MLKNITAQLKAGATTVQVEKVLDYAAVLALFDELHLQHPDLSCFKPHSYTAAQASTRITVRAQRQSECAEAAGKIAEISKSPEHLHIKYYALLALFTRHDPDRVLSYPGGNHYTLALAVKLLFSLEGIDAQVVKARRNGNDIYVVDACYGGRRKLTIPYLDSQLCGGAGGWRYFFLGSFINAHAQSGWITFDPPRSFEGRSFFEKKAAIVGSGSLEGLQGLAGGFTNAFALTPAAMADTREIGSKLSAWAMRSAFSQGWFFNISSHSISEFFVILNGKKNRALCIAGDVAELTYKYCEATDEPPLLVSPEADCGVIGLLVSAYQARYQVQLALKRYTQCGFAICKARRKQGECQKRVCQLVPGMHRWYTQFLTVQQREAANAVVLAALQMRGEVFVPTALKLTSQDVNCIFEILRLDYPELFYMSIVEVSSDDNYVLSIKLSRKYPQVVAEKQKRLLSTARALLAEWEQSGQPLRLCFYQFLNQHVVYYAETDLDADSDYLNAVGCLIDKKCACRGIAEAFQLLSGLSGKKSLMVIGIGNGGPHAWNIAKIDGAWCNIDFTWNLNTDSYLFMCCADSYFPNHAALQKFAYPRCQTMRHYYYATVYQYVLSGGDQQETAQSVESCIAEQMQQGRREIVLNIKNCDISGFAKQHLTEILRYAIKKSGKAVKINNISVLMGELLRISIGSAECAAN